MPTQLSIFFRYLAAIQHVECPSEAAATAVTRPQEEASLPTAECRAEMDSQDTAVAGPSNADEGVVFEEAAPLAPCFGKRRRVTRPAG